MDLDVLHFSSTEKYRYRPIEGKIYPRPPPPIPTSTAVVMCKILPMLTFKYKGFWVIGYLARNKDRRRLNIEHCRYMKLLPFRISMILASFRKGP